ncbi:hypothetical protein Gohar_009819, partial [Gossypium harknessii]|nr:hypothetical protein [Gossypium harknessii]
NNPKKSGPTLNETFLGLLYPTENYKVYGYLTNTKVKFILVTTDLDVRDADVRNVVEFPRRTLATTNNGSLSFSPYLENYRFDRAMPSCWMIRWFLTNVFGTGLVVEPVRPPVQLVHTGFGTIIWTGTWLADPVWRFHAAYVDAVSNPFHVPGKKITSRTFADRVSTIVQSFGLSSAV